MHPQGSFGIHIIEMNSLNYGWSLYSERASILLQGAELLRKLQGFFEMLLVEKVYCFAGGKFISLHKRRRRDYFEDPFIGALNLIFLNLKCAVKQNHRDWS